VSGLDHQQSTMFSYLSPEQRVPSDHPLRAVRQITDTVLKQLSQLFSGMYAKVGRRSIPPETLLRALLLQVLYTVRSERMLMEQLEYNLLFRWFVGLNMDEPVWDVTVFTKNRERLLKADVAKQFFQLVVDQARSRNLMSDEHFTVDGTLLEACASLKSFKKIGGDPEPPPDDPGNPTVDFHGEKRSNQTHESTTDADALLAKKGTGKEAKLSYGGHVGADKGYDTKDFVAEARNMNVTPHVAQNNKGRKSAIDGRTTRHPGYLISQQKRKRLEEIFGWMKTVGGMRKLRHRVCS
jgi:transposase